MGINTEAPRLSLDTIKSCYKDIMDSDLERAVPVVYCPSYNISFYGLEKLHPFDSCKFGRIYRALCERGLLSEAVCVREVPLAVLHDVHTEAYLSALHSRPSKVAEVVELAPLRLLPMPVLQRLLLGKLRRHAAGTMLAAALALRHGWAINLGGGMHHARAGNGEGWCPYSDIMLAVRRARVASGGSVQRVLVVDTDAHQGNGYARDKLRIRDDDLIILDVYNADVFPQDCEAREGITIERRLSSGSGDAEYLEALRSGLAEALTQRPDLVIHNAGSDVLCGDPLGRLHVSASALAERDMLVWSACRGAGVPVCALLSGGYARHSVPAVVDSLAAILESERARASCAVK